MRAAKGAARASRKDCMMEASYETRGNVVEAWSEACYARELAEGMVEVLNGLSTRGVEVGAPAFMLLGEAAKAIEGKLSECDARLGEAVGSMPASDLP